MGFRFQKRIRIFKGLTLNLSKSGTSWTVGGPGASVNLKDGKATGTVGTRLRRHPEKMISLSQSL